MLTIISNILTDLKNQDILKMILNTEINYVFEKCKTRWKNQSIKKLQAILDKLNKILD